MKQAIAAVSICIGMSGLTSMPAQALPIVTSLGFGSPVELIAGGCARGVGEALGAIAGARHTAGPCQAAGTR
jgi:hypothetical protein